MKTVAVTGASGYIAGVLVKHLVENGYKVHATVRDLKNSEKTSALKLLPNVTLFEADLLKPGSFQKCFTNCDAVFHVAAVVKFKAKDVMKEIINPALKGAENVFQECLDCKVKNLVVTSSVAAVRDKSKDEKYEFSEKDFNDSVTPKSSPYAYAKVQSEKLLWKLWEKNKGKILMSTVNPSVVVGPTIHPRTTGFSVSTVFDIVSGKFHETGLPYGKWNTIDVRDVAKMHLLLYEKGIDGKRVIVATPKPFKVMRYVEILKEHFPKFKYPEKEMEPYLFSPGVLYNSSYSKELGLEMIPLEKSLKDMVDGFIEMKLLKNN